MVRILLRFPQKIVDRPVIADVILQQRISLNILAAHVDSNGGEVLIEVPAQNAGEAIESFKQKGVTVIIPKLVEVDKQKCINCGACFSLCPVNAITVKEDYSVEFDREKCVGSSCGLCVDACPVRAVTLTKEYSGSNSENKKSS